MKINHYIQKKQLLSILKVKTTIK